jgi:hypothetical protein
MLVPLCNVITRLSSLPVSYLSKTDLIAVRTNRVKEQLYWFGELYCYRQLSQIYFGQSLR